MQFSRYILPSANTLQFLLKEPGSHLLSHAVSSIVPSAAQVLTIVFGMGTGVSPKRIDTENLYVIFRILILDNGFLILDNLTVQPTLTYSLERR